MQVFYSAFQALLYVLCYHLEGLMQQNPAPAAAAAVDHRQQLSQPQPQQQPGGSAGSGAGGLPATIRLLFQTVFPPLLAHRLAPPGTCSAWRAVQPH